METELKTGDRPEIRAIRATFQRIEAEAAALKTGGALERGIYAARVAASAVELLGLLVERVAELEADMSEAYEWMAAIDHAAPPGAAPKRAGGEA